MFHMQSTAGVRKYVLARPQKVVMNYCDPNISRACNFVENTYINYKTTNNSNFLAQNCMKLST